MHNWPILLHGGYSHLQNLPQLNVPKTAEINSLIVQSDGVPQNVSNAINSAACVPFPEQLLEEAEPIPQLLQSPNLSPNILLLELYKEYSGKLKSATNL
jgi:hypothetical protein